MRLNIALCALILAVGSFATTQAQYFQYSQYNFTDQRVNPAMVAASNYASADFIYRSQSAANDIRLRSTMFSASYPLLSRRNGLRWSGIGVSAMDDRSGGIFSIQEAALSYAVNIFLSRYQTLSLGIKGLYQNRKVDMDGLFTGSQYVPDRGFDVSLSSGEEISSFQSSFMTFSSGVYWQQSDKAGNRLAYWGISLFDFNKPDESFYNTASKLSSTIVFNGGVQIYKENDLSVTPEILLTRSAGNNVLNAGFITGYEIKGKGRIDLISKYVLKRSGILGLQWHRENISFGVSYDFPVVTRNAANFQTLEVAIQLRRLVDPKLKRKSNAKRLNNDKNVSAKKETPINKPVTKTPSKVTTPAKDSISTKVVKKEDLKTTLKHKQDSALATAQAGKIKHQPLILDKVVLHFNFEFNSSDLDEESTRYLDDLTAALLENAHLNIQLTGHTDNVGSAKFNEKLSLYRANSIKEYLVSKGISGERIKAVGKGLTEPLNDNRTEKDRAQNRRVELVIFYTD